MTPKRSVSYSSAIAIGLMLCLNLSSPLYSQDLTSTTPARPVLTPQAAAPIPPGMMEFLRERDRQTARVWVFFTDKGVVSQVQYDSLASTISLSDKQLARRGKVGRARVLFADLPVHESYTGEVSSLGGKLRRNSRWLNAASFELPIDSLERVARLPFVASLRPVAVYTRPIEPADSLKEYESFEAVEEIAYGMALSQLTQIRVPAVHSRGYNGSGVILAIFDSGYRKTHEAFALHYTEGRVLAEYDFINNDENTANEEGDPSNQWNHGTYCWSIAGGYRDGRLYGPAFASSFILAKTEMMDEEIRAEEDNWVAALEWVEGLGTDVVTSSLGYIDWYTIEDLDGATAVTTIAANTAASLGIVLCDAVGNEGPAPSTLIAPADAHDILAVGAVDALGNLATFSSRGPTYDRRIKPEVCARGISTAMATASSDTYYGYGSGTSMATPLVAGVACLLVQAYPSLPPQIVRQSLMETASRSDAPDNNYGWGLINAEAALDWSVGFTADTCWGDVPLTVQFAGQSGLQVSSWSWSLGDGTAAYTQNPSHVYNEPGTYDVMLEIQTEYGELRSFRPTYIIAVADTLSFESDSAYAGDQVVISVSLVNSQALEEIRLPFQIVGDLDPRLDSACFGARTAYFESLQWPLWDPLTDKYEIRLTADYGQGSPPLPAGSGEILKMFFTIDVNSPGGLMSTLDTLNDTRTLKLSTGSVTYAPRVFPGTISSRIVVRGDADNNGQLDIEDGVFIVDYVFRRGDEPPTVQSADIDGDLDVDIDDIIYLIDYMFSGGAAPPAP